MTALILTLFAFGLVALIYVLYVVKVANVVDHRGRSLRVIEDERTGERTVVVVQQGDAPTVREEVGALLGGFRWRDLLPNRDARADALSGIDRRESAPSEAPTITVIEAIIDSSGSEGGGTSREESTEVLTIDQAVARILANEGGPSIALLGPSRSGKTSLMRAILKSFGGEFFVVDPNAKIDEWKGVPVVTTSHSDGEEDWSPVSQAIANIDRELKDRVGEAKSGGYRQPLISVLDETNLIVDEVPESIELIRNVAKRGAGYQMRVLICPHSDIVTELGLSLNMRKNFTWFYLGDHARTKAQTLLNSKRIERWAFDALVTESYPCLLELAGRFYLIDNGASSPSKWEVDGSKVWVPASAPVSEEKVDPVYLVLARLVKAKKIGQVEAIEVGLGHASGSGKAYTTARAGVLKALESLSEE